MLPETEFIAREKDHIWHPLTQHAAYNPLSLAGGQGVYVVDDAGQKFMDAAAGLWCVNVGYGRMELVDAAMTQMAQLAYMPLTQSSSVVRQLASRLAQLLPNNPHIYFANSGSEANETAFKMVRQYRVNRGQYRKTKIISRHRGYHGSTLGALAATGQPERRRDYEVAVTGFVQVAAPYCYRCPFKLSYPSCQMQCADDFERRVEIEGPDTVAAFIVEPIGAGGGILVPPPEYLQRLRDIADRYDISLIVDEVVTGFGRTGSMFAHQTFGVTADIVTMAKGFTSGYLPMSAVAVSEEIFSGFLGEAESGRHLRTVNTYAGHPVAAAVALKNIEILEQESLPERAQIMGRYLRVGLQALQDLPTVGDVRGLGLLAGVELLTDKATKEKLPASRVKRVVANLKSQGFLFGKMTDVDGATDNVLLIAPPLVITPSQIDELLQALRVAIVEECGD